MLEQYCQQNPNNKILYHLQYSMKNHMGGDDRDGLRPAARDKEGDEEQKNAHLCGGGQTHFFFGRISD
jgi:hypothetical protein